MPTEDSTITLRNHELGEKLDSECVFSNFLKFIGITYNILPITYTLSHITYVLPWKYDPCDYVQVVRNYVQLATPCQVLPVPASDRLFLSGTRKDLTAGPTAARSDLSGTGRTMEAVKK